jgi:hypothetical protein
MNWKKKHILILIVLVVCCVVLFAGDASAQCAMCKASAEANLKEGGSGIGKGLNKGILYLLSIPYILAGIFAFVWYRKKKEIKKFFRGEAP